MDIPYFLYDDTIFDTLAFSGDEKFRTNHEFLEAVVVSTLEVVKKDAFGFVYCSFVQCYQLKELFEAKGVHATVCVVTRQRPNNLQTQRSSTKSPLNVCDFALHLVFGSPTWANYGKDDSIE